MEKLSVYKQMTAGTNECLAVIKREIGLKTTCMPFAVKLIEALGTLNCKTEQEQLNAANTLLSGLQTLWHGGITAEDYDKMDFVKRGGVIVPSARVEAFIRASARKGYRISDTIVPVPKEDANTTYWRENLVGENIVYTLEDQRKNPDRAVTAQRLASKYFNKFLCRLDVHDIAHNRRVAMTAIEMSVDDILKVAECSEQGLYKSNWEEYQTRYGVKRYKVITNELNPNSFWGKWTGEMVNKTIIRRALKRLKEILPELEDTIYAFESDEEIKQNEQAEPTYIVEQPKIEIPVETEDVDLGNLTDEQKEDCDELYEIFCANPKLAEDKTEEIKEMFKSGKPRQEVINEEYAALSVLLRSARKQAELKEYLCDEKNQA